MDGDNLPLLAIEWTGRDKNEKEKYQWLFYCVKPGNDEKDEQKGITHLCKPRKPSLHDKLNLTHASCYCLNVKTDRKKMIICNTFLATTAPLGPPSTD
jgi:hypothetical protein